VSLGPAADPAAKFHTEQMGLFEAVSLAARVAVCVTQDRRPGENEYSPLLK
jgi:hypothetical protein